MNKSQSLQFELMKLSSFNEFNGEQVVRDLEENQDLWIGCVWGRFHYHELIPLRDIAEGVWNTDTLYILAKTDKVSQLKRMAIRWKCDEFGVVYHDREEGSVGFLHQDTWKVFGGSLKEVDGPDKCIIRIWWD